MFFIVYVGIAVDANRVTIIGTRHQTHQNKLVRMTYFLHCNSVRVVCFIVYNKNILQMRVFRAIFYKLLYFIILYLTRKELQ